MSVIQFQCYACDQVLKVGADKAGKKAKCIKCGTVLTIPSQPAATTPPNPPPPVGGGKGGRAAPRPVAPEPLEEMPAAQLEEEPVEELQELPAAIEEIDEGPRSERRHEEEDDDRPRKRRRDEDDYDDRPRSRRRDEEDDYDDRPRSRRHEDEEDRPRRRREEDDYDYDREQERPKKSKKARWNWVRVALLLILVGVSVISLALLIQIVAYLVAFSPRRGLRMDMQSNINIFFVLVRIAEPVALIGSITCIVGYIFCLLGPSKKGAFGLGIALICVGVLHIILALVTWFPLAFGQITFHQGGVTTWILLIATQIAYSVEYVLGALLLRAYSLARREQSFTGQAWGLTQLGIVYGVERLFTYVMLWVTYRGVVNLAANVDLPIGMAIFTFILFWLGVLLFLGLIVWYGLLLWNMREAIGPQES